MQRPVQSEMCLLALYLLVAAPVACAAQVEQLTIRFIGNAGFILSDGQTSLMLDLPYRSGAFGYMTYDPESLKPEGRVVSVITHDHADHFASQLFRKTSWEIVGPRQVTEPLAKERVLPLADELTVGRFKIRPLRSSHGETEHYSYEIDWRGKRFHFTGDTEDPATVLAAESLDIAFLTPWISCRAARSGKQIDARRSILHHQHADGRDKVCGEVAALQQGQSITLAAGDSDPRQVSFPTQDGGTVHADVYGQGDRAVVLAHGGRFDKESWADQAPLLVQAGFRVIAIDFRGRGKSRGGPGSKSQDDGVHFDVQAAVRYARESGASSVAVIGASFGGWAAARAAVERPGEIDRLVLLATGVDEPERLTGRKLFILARDDFRGEGELRLPEIREQYGRAPQPKELVLLEGSAHAQFLFETDQAGRLMNEILRFLTHSPGE